MHAGLQGVLHDFNLVSIILQHLPDHGCTNSYARIDRIDSAAAMAGAAGLAMACKGTYEVLKAYGLPQLVLLLHPGWRLGSLVAKCPRRLPKFPYGVQQHERQRLTLEHVIARTLQHIIDTRGQLVQQQAEREQQWHDMRAEMDDNTRQQAAAAAMSIIGHKQSAWTNKLIEVAGWPSLLDAAICSCRCYFSNSCSCHSDSEAIKWVMSKAKYPPAGMAPPTSAVLAMAMATAEYHTALHRTTVHDPAVEAIMEYMAQVNVPHDTFASCGCGALLSAAAWVGGWAAPPPRTAAPPRTVPASALPSRWSRMYRLSRALWQQDVPEDVFAAAGGLADVLLGGYSLAADISVYERLLAMPAVTHDRGVLLAVTHAASRVSAGYCRLKGSVRS